jgi:hypothetical protein
MASQRGWIKCFNNTHRITFCDGTRTKVLDLCDNDFILNSRIAHFVSTPHGLHGTRRLHPNVLQLSGTARASSLKTPLTHVDNSLCIPERTSSAKIGIH